MLRITVAGRLGRDAEHKQTQGGHDLCSFSVAADVGFGDNKQTYWVDVTKWGKGAQGLAGILQKGSAVAVIGELTTREHDGKTYLQCRADDVTVLGGTRSRDDQHSNNLNRGDTSESNGSNYDDLDDDLSDAPF